MQDNNQPINRAVTKRYCLLASEYPLGGVDTDAMEMTEHEDAVDACLCNDQSSRRKRTNKGGNYPTLNAFEAKLRAVGIDPTSAFVEVFPKRYFEGDSKLDGNDVCVRLYSFEAAETQMKELGFFAQGARLPY